MYTFIFFIHSFIATLDLGYLHAFAIVSNAAMNIGLQIFFQDSGFAPLHIDSEEVWLSHLIFSIFNFLKTLHTVFHHGFTFYILSSSQCANMLLFPHPHQYFCSLSHMIVDILIDKRGYLCGLHSYFPGDYWCCAALVSCTSCICIFFKILF